MPRVSFENFREAKITGLYCSRIGSTEFLISSDAACRSYNKKKKKALRDQCLDLIPEKIKIKIKP